MAKKPRQKLKLIMLKDILYKNTDDSHGLTLNEIIKKLEENGISAERKSLYDDMELLRLYGCDICTDKTNTVRYYIGKRDFQLPELKLLVDAVQSSKFITQKKSNELISKVEALASDYTASKLQRQVFVTNRVKNPNEKIYYAVDEIHNAISAGKQITFRYYEWVLSRRGGDKIIKQAKKDGTLYQVSPFALAWDDENYYLIAFDSVSREVRHYRVDKMESVSVTSLQREGEETFADFDMAVYSKSVFGMFGGKKTKVDIRVSNDLVGVIVDRFGKDIFVKDNSDGTFTFCAEVVLSRQFFGWLFGLGKDARLVAPKWAEEEFKSYLFAVADSYK